jgi:hypothetical protein
MGYLIFMSLMLLLAIVGVFIKVPETLSTAKKAIVSFVAVVGIATGVTGAFQYNDAGYCQHIQTIAGTEDSTCSLGWYFQGWGTSTAWPHFITIAHTDATGEGGSSINRPYSVRLSDNWAGDVTQTTRFGIPKDGPQFLKMHNDFRSVDRLITTTLKPAVTSSLDSIANTFSMEEYYAGGQRDQFKTEYLNSVTKGRAQVKQSITYKASSEQDPGGQAPNDLDGAQDKSQLGGTKVRTVKMIPVRDENGNIIRVPHNYVTYGITVSSAIIENLDPDDLFEQQIQARKEAASRRIVAQEERREQEEQRLLAIQTGETNIAKKQADARVVQIEKTTNAETAKKLALIEANLQKEKAAVAKETSQINLEKAKIDAEAVVVTADADAYEREQLLASDNGLALKVKAIVQMNKDAMDAFAKRNVPTTVVYTGGAEGGALGANNEIENIATTQMLKNLKALDLDIGVKAVPAK